MAAPRFTAQRLNWTDQRLGVIPCPAAPMVLRSSYGSGLARRPGDPDGVVWAVGDRGPNLKVKTLVERYGLDHLRPLMGTAGAKVMPRVDLGPAIAQLRIAGDAVEILSTLRLTDAQGTPISGLPMPGGDHAISEPAFDLDGRVIAPDPSGLDSEGIVALADGSFVVGDEFGPSLVRIAAEGQVLARFVPETVTLTGARYPVHRTLPAIAARRQINRGFEAIAASADGERLFLAFQSPLAHPDPEAHAAARHVRLWRLDGTDMRVAAQYLYPLDPPESFSRDAAVEAITRSDIKVSELVWLGEDRLLVLERASRTSKLFRVDLDPARALGAEHLDLATRPTVEQLSAQDVSLPTLAKTLLLSTDDLPQVGADLEGMAVLSPYELLLVSDNDFGVEGAETGFWKIVFEEPVLG
ncbi:esterase-like activity of phytase family protein [Sphingosinicella sp. BN140058]|uniref:esterase-like activity of phytase family protein n=1 Tax=Sphingosinicella sp. BN140058 TaxID=1892855 RepID=UPI0010104F60|nr:esterase-like activity of phytase family protein [Sphingosinicella sp. BN140058]QAY75398.1 esterase-like activity of phytase family protein [Sphingosinicella sp. BN140058]